MHQRSMSDFKTKLCQTSEIKIPSKFSKNKKFLKSLRNSSAKSTNQKVNSKCKSKTDYW